MIRRNKAVIAMMLGLAMGYFVLLQPANASDNALPNPKTLVLSKDNSQNADSLAQSAGQLQRAGKSAEALSAAQKSLALAPTRSVTFQQLAYVFMKNNKFEEAKHMFEASLKTSKEPMVILSAASAFASMAKSQGELDKFVAEAEKGHAKNSSDDLSVWKLIYGYAALGQTDKAIGIVKSAIEKNHS